MKNYFSIFILLSAIITYPGVNMVMAKLPGNATVGGTLSVPQVKDFGIGPVKKVILGPINKTMVEEGRVIYTNQCTVCHDMDQKKIGPALRNVTKLRTPEYLMNLLLNSAQMQKDNATVRELLKQYNDLPMPDPWLNQAKARSVVEYLRSVVK